MIKNCLDCNKAYFAGFFDGEGCILIAKHSDPRGNRPYPYHTLCVQITNTDLPILEKFKEEYGGRIASFGIRGKNHKPAWGWRVTNKKAFLMLDELMPYLRIKRPQAIVAMELRDSINNNNRGAYTETLFLHREKIRHAIHQLNGRKKAII